jgi:serine phosphatase RsbU (regulator of sigma subunit)
MMKRWAAFSTIVAILFLAGYPLFAQTLYWEQPTIFVPQQEESSMSAAGRSFMTLAWQEIKPVSATDRSSGDIYLSLAVSRDGVSWTTHARAFGPIHYTGVTEGSEPRVFSLAMDDNDRIHVAVAASDREIDLLQSDDQGVTFRIVQRLTDQAALGAPTVYMTRGGGFLLVVSRGSSSAELASGKGSVSLACSRSSNGSSWSPLAPLVTEADNAGVTQLQPSHATFQGREYVVFQALVPRNEIASTWQLFIKSSADGGATWNKAAAITSQGTAFGGDPLSFNNERPRLAALGTQLGLVWERSPFGNDRPQIWSARLDGKGGLIGAPEAVSVDIPSRFAHIVVLRGVEYVLYADSSSGTSRIVLAQKSRTWETQPLPNTGVVNALFPHAAVFSNSLYVFWENQPQAGGTYSLVQLRPLGSVGAPVVRPVDFVPGQPSNRDAVTVSWTEPQPPDPSGIKEYRYTWTYSDGGAPVEKDKGTVSGLTSLGKGLFSTRKVDKDGTWTFSITAQDLAGNTTKTPASVSFTRDATPPRQVSFQVVGADGATLLTAPPGETDKRDTHSYVLGSNSFTLRWLPQADTDVVGYTYNVQPGWTTVDDYVHSRVALVSPPARVVTTSPQVDFRNRDNGVYAVTVRAVDRAGNIGAPSTIALALGNYQVVTRVDFVTADKDPVLGTVKLTISGRGFVENGRVRKIYLDSGHKAPPFDMEFDPVAPITISDRLISGIVLDQNRDSGSYRIGLLQESPTGQQAVYFTPGPLLDFRSPGTVKIGNFQILLPGWVVGASPRHIFSFDTLLVVLVVALLGALSFLAIRKIAALAQEGAIVNEQVVALLEGRTTLQWEERKKRMQALKKRGMGLRLKFTLLMVVLVIMIVLIVSVPLGFQMVNRQRLTLATGLKNDANILIGALSSSAETQFLLQNQGFEAAADIPKLRSEVAEAVYTTITGPDQSFRPTDPKDFVWASDEKRFTDELSAGRFSIASERVDDALARSIIPALQKKIDADATAKLGTLVDEYRSMSAQQRTLVTKTDPASKGQSAKLAESLKQVQQSIETQVRQLPDAQMKTFEAFDPGAPLRPTYLFYKPIVFYNRAANVTDTTFYQGMVRLQVKTDAITKQIDDAIGAILRTATLIALAAIALGILGAVIMANITVTPIRKLARGVAFIRDTEDKEQLKDHSIEVGTRDEIGLLAETVNEMTQGLVKAAAANKELLLGKDVQKMFLPLEKDSQNRKGTTAGEETAAVEIYGYYEGAKGVSGDYFDYKKLDETHYALIKCDVAGKGVPAALIMVEVATVFISYFRDWVKRRENIAQIKDPKAKQRALQELVRLDLLVYTINDMLEERGFKGRFAALTICIFDAETGMATVCNAGDNLMHIYEAKNRRMVQTKLPDSPAAGVFPSMLVEMKSGFKQVPQPLAKGDALFMFTDGFEEAKRSFRNSVGEVVPCEEPGLKDGEPHAVTHTRGQTSEEFGTPRIEAIVDAVFARETYRLVRNHVSDPSEVLDFDFSACAGTVKEAVLALVAVEKVFRSFRDPSFGPGNRVRVESKIDEFLKAHFVQYASVFEHRGEPQPGETTVTFTHLKEDEQYDDLTILVLRRK